VRFREFLLRVIYTIRSRSGGRPEPVRDIDLCPTVAIAAYGNLLHEVFHKLAASLERPFDVPL
jgi:hypothetical protein